MKQATKSTVRRVILFLLLIVGYVKLQLSVRADEGCYDVCQAGREACEERAEYEYDLCYDLWSDVRKICLEHADADYGGCLVNCIIGPPEDYDKCKADCEKERQKDKQICEDIWVEKQQECSDSFDRTWEACRVGYEACIEKCS